MAGPGTYEPIVEPDPFLGPFEWVEKMDTSDPGGDDVISNKAVDSTIVVRIKPLNGALITQSKIRSALNYVLGYSYADAAAPWKLHRYPPPAHPRYGPQCRPTGVSLRLETPIGNSTNVNFSPYEFSDVVFDNITRIGRYAQAYLTVKFTTQPQNFYGDTNPLWNGLESGRYVTYWEQNPKIEVIEAETGPTFIWTDGPANNPNGKAFPGRIGEKVNKNLLQILWHQVPQSFICDSSGLATKIIAATGCVNSTSFLGQPAQTLLMQEPVLTKYMFPFLTVDGPAFWYDVQLSFLQFDPKVGTSGTLAGDRGWRLMPWRAGGTSTGSAGYGGVGTTGGAGWYGARRADSAAGVIPPTASGAAPTILPEVDFATIFTHVRS